MTVKIAARTDSSDEASDQPGKIGPLVRVGFAVGARQ
jgi:hypothetical protein